MITLKLLSSALCYSYAAWQSCDDPGMDLLVGIGLAETTASAQVRPSWRGEIAVNSEGTSDAIFSALVLAIIRSEGGSMHGDLLVDALADRLEGEEMDTIWKLARIAVRRLARAEVVSVDRMEIELLE